MSLNKKSARFKINVMKKNVQIMLVVASMMFLSVNVFAETKEWKTEVLDNGKTTIQWSISKDDYGMPVIEYVATSTAKVGIQQLISVLKDAEKHKVFNDDKDSKTLKALSGNEWIIYYYHAAPWPLTDSETVAKMVFAEDAVKKVASFKVNVDPNIKHPRKKNVNRMAVLDVTYTFKDVGNGNVDITIASKSVAPIKVPGWIISGMFPDMPADTINGIVKLANTNSTVF